MVVIRDTALWILGVGGIIHQEWTGEVRVELLLVYTSILTIPGGFGLYTLIRGASTTPVSPSQSVEQPPSEAQSAS